MSNVNGLCIGRFQPFHLGHLSAIKQALKKVDKLYIGIGSSQYDHEEYNPFTAEERREMIQRALEENGLSDRCEIPADGAGCHGFFPVLFPMALKVSIRKDD